MREAERLLSGRDYLAAAVDLLHRVRASHPTAGVWEAADPEWWWRKPRPTDEWDQLFWFVDEQPIAAAIATDWAGRLVATRLSFSGSHRMSSWGAGPPRPVGICAPPSA